MTKGAKNHRGGNSLSFPWGIFKGGSTEKIALEFDLETWGGMCQFKRRGITSQKNEQCFRGVHIRIVPRMWIGPG